MAGSSVSTGFSKVYEKLLWEKRLFITEVIWKYDTLKS